MHDLVNDLAQYASGEFCSKFEDGKVHVIGKNVRHFAFLMDPVEKDGPEKFVYFNEVKSLRTFLPLTCLNPSRCFALGEMVLPVLLQKMKHLRVLSVSRYAIDKLPNSLGKLTHLRYFDLSYTSIRKLPSSIGSLYNLQTLLLSNCHFLTVLPPEIVDLINLRHLDECWGLHGMRYLRHFEITGGCNMLMFFPQVELLPNTLTSLRIKTSKAHILGRSTSAPHLDQLP
ncbi:putative disease resistance RPP13-like protein 1 isoform X1 [Fagus crenata]